MPESQTSQQFNGLLQQYYRVWFRYHPEQAVHVGIGGYEEKLRAYDNDDIGALIALNEKLLFSLDEMDFSALSADQQIDYSILYNAASRELQEILTQDWRYRCPQAYLPVEAIHQLLSRPVENMHKAVKHRLQQIPEYLRGARANLSDHPERIPSSWCDSAIKEAQAGSVYIRNLPRHPVLMQQFNNPTRMQPVCDEAATALDEYAHFLHQDLLPRCSGDFAVGEDYFNSLLNESHFLGINAVDLYQFGERLFKETQAELDAMLESDFHGRSREEVMGAIREDYPAGGEDALLNAYRRQMKSAYEFIKQADLVTVPEKQALKVMSTPTFMRHEIPFAAYDEPTYKDPEQRGYYYVTPVLSEGQKLEHNYTSIGITCVHEAFPGHHLQFVTANQNPSNSLPRMLNASSTLYEGWALYCEELMQEEGFLPEPEHRFMMLRDRLWRAMRVMLDVELHSRGLSVDEAAQRMCRQLGFDIDQAKADLSWYTQAPTLPMGYAVGWALIKALREIESQKDGFNLKGFHDQLLSVGSCALPLVIKRAFGEASWQQCKQKVFEI